MINTAFNLASIAGIVIAVAGAALYALRSVRPELSRDHDIFFSAVGLLCGLILVFQGWRFDPIMQFGQVLLTGATIFFAVENLRMRSITTEQAKRNTPIVDEEREVSRVYETVHAELDELEPLDDERPVRRQIRGTRDARSTRTSEYDDEAPRRRSRTDEYDDEARSRPSNRSSGQRLGQGDKQRRRNSRPASRPVERPEEDEWSSPNRSDDWNSSGGGVSKSSDDWDVSAGSVSRSPRPSSNGNSRSDRSPDTSKPRKRRQPQDPVSRRDPDGSARSMDYTDYKPVARSDDEPDNSANFDET